MTPASHCHAPLAAPPRSAVAPRWGKWLAHRLGFWLLATVVWILATAAKGIRRVFDLPTDVLAGSRLRGQAPAEAPGHRKFHPWGCRPAPGHANLWPPAGKSGN